MLAERYAIRVMVLDDEAFTLKLLQKMLHKLGVREVITCLSGGEALLYLSGTMPRPDLILCDLNMPGMDGIEFVRALVAHDYCGSVILMSGEDERVLHTAAKLAQEHRLTILGQLVKPVSPAGLRGLLASWLPPIQRQPRVDHKAYSADELRHAIVTGQLVNHYQPVVNVASRQCVGVEVLVRWRHPQDGLVMPDRFIGLAESHGLIDDLTTAVVRAVFAQMGVWDRAGHTLSVAINVSMMSLTTLSFPDTLAACARAENVVPRRVKLEVTETQLLKDMRNVLDVLVRLRLKGFHLSIDDFGTGHSSLAQLRDIPFDQIKIDRGFVHGAGSDRTVRAIYDASLGLANQLGFEAVAEGVEDQEDWDLVQRTGCSLAQGYFIGRPVPAERLPDLLAAWEERVRGELKTAVGPLEP